MNKRIYADNAATTRLSFEALVEMNRTFDLYGNPSSSHAEGREAKKKLEEYRARCAVCLDCEPNEIVFTSGATEGNLTVNINGWFRAVSAVEHPSNRPESCDCVLPIDPNGIVL